jgi:hypothetical protein
MVLMQTQDDLKSMKGLFRKLGVDAGVPDEVNVPFMFDMNGISVMDSGLSDRCIAIMFRPKSKFGRKKIYGIRGKLLDKIREQDPSFARE